MITPLTLHAKAFAIKAHEDTNHRYGEHPYHYHLGMVATYATRFGHLLISDDDREIAVAAAWVHDTIEDARVSYNDLTRAVGVRVAEVAYALTNDKGRTRGERASAWYYRAIATSQVATFVKICDRLANAQHSRDTGGRMLERYRKEQPAFESYLYTPQFGPMWALLGEILCGG